jgi:type III secretion protein V
MNKLNKIVAIFQEHKELSLIILILCVIGMIIVPIPHTLMDVLIGVNIGLTILVLMVVLYMKSPLELTSFPSILLVLALFRIGITISSSRLILLDGDAGQIISTFGAFVVGGNLIVGVIMFTIITLINFIVITKGAERVAEVAARFSLDAMPGKQMSIDSDLRAGNIDMKEAQRRRNSLVLESKLFGAMDGSMKFVKGDAIASIIDILINLVGGLVIGLVQKGMGFGEALQVYSILTVGDGLVQQIPALMISLTAGLMITRVSDDDSPDKENLGKNIINQIFTNSKTLFSASSLFVLMGCIPGMPTGVFAVLFCIIVGIGIYIKKNKGSNSAKANELVEESVGNDNNLADNDTISWKVQPIVLNLATDMKNNGTTKIIKKALIEIRNNILVTLGVEIPQIIIRYSNALEKNTYQLMIFEIPVTTATIYHNHILLLENSNEVLNALNIGTEIKNNTDIGLPVKGFWIPENLKQECIESELSFLSIDGFISAHLAKIIGKHISEFLGMQEVKNLLDKASEYQDLIKELLRMLPLNKITEVLQRLVAEGVSIRNFKLILDAMLEWSQREKEVVIITEYVRQALGRYIAYKYSDGTYIIPCFILDTDIEDMIRDAIRFNDRGSFLSVDPDDSNIIISKVKESFESLDKLKVDPVILTHMDVRRYFKSIIENDLPYINVLSYQELEAHVKFTNLGVIEL